MGLVVSHNHYSPSCVAPGLWPDIPAHFVLMLRLDLASDSGIVCLRAH